MKWHANLSVVPLLYVYIYIYIYLKLFFRLPKIYPKFLEKFFFQLFSSVTLKNYFWSFLTILPEFILHYLLQNLLKTSQCFRNFLKIYQKFSKIDWQFLYYFYKITLKFSYYNISVIFLYKTSKLTQNSPTIIKEFLQTSFKSLLYFSECFKISF